MSTHAAPPDAPPELPSIFDYLDYRAFLRDWLARKREQKPSYTFGVFARQAKMSRSALPNVLEGRREASPQTVEGIARALRMDAEERDFLVLLVALKRASSLEENGRLLRQIFAHPRYAPGQVVDTRQLEVLTSWTRIAVLEASKLPDFRADPAWLAERLRPEVQPEEVSEALEALRAEGLVAAAEDEEEGSVGPHRLHTPPEFDGIAAYRLHQSYLDAAKDALQQVHFKARNYGVLGLTVPRAAVPDLLAEVQAFVERMRELADGYGTEADTVVQLNVQSWVVAELGPVVDTGVDDPG